MGHRRIGAVIVLMILSLLTHGGSAILYAADTVRIGDPVPPLMLREVLQSSSGEPIALAGLKGKVVVLEFWGIACSPCIKKLNLFNSLCAKFRNQPVEFIGVTRDKKQIVERFLQKKTLNFPIGIDTDSTFYKAFGVHSIPHTVIIDANGIVVANAFPDDITEQNLQKILRGEPSSITQRDGPTLVNAKNLFETLDTNNRFQVVIRSTRLQSIGMANSGRQWGFYGWDPARLILYHDTTAKISRSVFPEQWSREIYDIEVVVPDGMIFDHLPEFRDSIRAKLKIKDYQEVRLMAGYALQRDESLPISIPVSNRTKDTTFWEGKAKCYRGHTMASLSNMLESMLGQPVFDDTGIQGRLDYNIELEFAIPEVPYINAEVISKLGLRLVPTERPIKVIVFEQQ